jgi:natural product biosynthesis luciferase-like monooxygenase protein
LEVRAVEFSLFYFASNDADSAGDYDLLLKGAEFADANGFSAVWTPERHFHEFGGLYANPAVSGAAVAAVTRNVRIRAGSVVSPLHNPIRIAEEWAMVDNLSHGRVDISFASGWHAEDFVFAPGSYAERRSIMRDQIEVVRRLWRGERIEFPYDAQSQVGLVTQPRPHQPELPIWLTSAGRGETPRIAGELGAGLLTHLLGQSIDDLRHNVDMYRDAFRPSRTLERPHVSLMLHTFIADSVESARETVRAPMLRYLRSSFDLTVAHKVAGGMRADPANYSDEELNLILEPAFNRYFDSSGLMGSRDSCQTTLDGLREVGVDEVACLIDFGVEPDAVMASLDRLVDLGSSTVSEPAAGWRAHDQP